MSLVGPRPPLPSEVIEYQPWQRRRLSVKPGLTGLWQVSGRNQIDFEQWMALDLEYIDNWSLWLDIKIILKTVPAVLRGSGAS
jgi:lipopolysaccharide/colanic/teichoic acid biosynthesis glycosyltransferase